MFLGYIVDEESSLPGDDTFAMQIGKPDLPFFDQLQGLPAAPLGTS